jgi:hypothetical protein
MSRGAFDLYIKISKALGKCVKPDEEIKIARRKHTKIFTNNKNLVYCLLSKLKNIPWFSIFARRSIDDESDKWFKKKQNKYYRNIKIKSIKKM